MIITNDKRGKEECAEFWRVREGFVSFDADLLTRPCKNPLLSPIGTPPIKIRSPRHPQLPTRKRCSKGFLLILLFLLFIIILIVLLLFFY